MFIKVRGRMKGKRGRNESTEAGRRLNNQSKHHIPNEVPDSFSVTSGFMQTLLIGL